MKKVQKKTKQKNLSVAKSKYLINKQRENLNNPYSFKSIESLDKQQIYKNLGYYY